jgi:inner membrane protein
MPTIISHPAVLLALRPVFKLRTSIYVIGAICSVLPDFDVIGFRFGIRYSDILGHRGLTHSLLFAVVLCAILSFLLTSKHTEEVKNRSRIFGFLFLCMASHGFLDALTDGGLGVAFFSPFSNTRYFFPWRPIQVSPIGVGHFLSGPATEVLRSEFIFVWLPCVFLFVAGTLLRGHDVKVHAIPDAGDRGATPTSASRSER